MIMPQQFESENRPQTEQYTSSIKASSFLRILASCINSRVFLMDPSSGVDRLEDREILTRAINRCHQVVTREIGKRINAAT